MDPSMLTPDQQEIAVRPPLTTSVFAAPGSGKTTVLTHHILYQLQNTNIRPNHIMAVTFTKQAALEMKSRVQEGLPLSMRQKGLSVQLGTFHAQMFAMLLACIPNIPVLLDGHEQFHMMRTALRMQSQDDRIDEVRRWLTVASRLRCVWPPRPASRRITRKVLAQYERLKSQNHRWDFDDILIYACDLLEHMNNKFSTTPLQYILMDEFQDTNEIQWQIVRRLVDKHGAELFVVGDDDQSIYGFRGANPELLVNFNQWFPNAVTRYLGTNFRSDVSVITASTKLILHNHLRKEKNIEGASTKQGVVKFVATATEELEAQSVCSHIRRKEGFGRAAVLARTRKQLERTWSILPESLRRTVEFRTFHDAKGKEWDAVHIVGAVENNPYLHNAQQEGDEEEERRTFYVAVTRAKHELFIYTPRSIGNRHFEPIHFISESGLEPM